MEKDLATSRHRGTLQPAEPAPGSVECERCGCRFVLSEATFGCPGCELMDEFKDYHAHDPA